MIDDEIYYYPLVQSPFGKVPLIGATMTTNGKKNWRRNIRFYESMIAKIS